MWVQTLLVSLGVVSIVAIRVPLNPLESTNLDTRTVPLVPEQVQSFPVYYLSDQNVNVYLDSHQPEEVVSKLIPPPATYLLPPSPDKQNEYFVTPTDSGDQTEWYPIDASAAKQHDAIPLQQVQTIPNEEKANLRAGRILHRGQVITVPSRNLLPPTEQALDDFVIVSPSADLELPLEEIDHTQNEKLNIELPFLRPPLDKSRPIFRLKPEPQPVPYITPPANEHQGNRIPTTLYPKKFINEFKPIPIPVSQYEKESEKHLRDVKPQSEDKDHHDTKHLTSSTGKKNYLSEEAEKKRKNRKTTANEAKKPAEQQVSESNHRHHANHIRPTHIRKEADKRKPENRTKGERTEFRMHGMKGPNSYQFGYDTGKGKNRQFRYEERDNDGHVRGHYGYVDKFGKLRVVNYDAHPEHGFRAEAPVVTD